MSEVVDRNPAMGRGRLWLRLVLVGCLFACASEAAASVRSQVLYARGLVPYYDGRWEQAFGNFDAAVAADSEDALALYYRGLTQARRGANEAAIADIRKALQVEPRLPNAPLDLGVALFNEGRFADAQRALLVSHGRGEQPEMASFFLGLCAYRLGDYADAVARFDEAGADEALRQSALYYSGLAQLRAGDETGARARLQQAASVQPDSEIGRLAARYAAKPAAAELAEAAPGSARPWNVHANVRLEYDSNVVAGASDGIAGTKEDGDGRPVLQAGGSYRLLETEAGTLAAGAELGQSIHFSLREFDLSTVRLRLDWTGAPGRWSYGAGGGYEFYALDYGAFSQAIQLQPWVAFHETPQTATQAYYRFRYRDYLDSPFDPFRDGLNNAVGLRQYWAPTRTLLTHVGYQFDMESPEDTGDSDPFLAAGADDFEYMGHQLDLGASSPLNLPVAGATAIRGGYRLRLDDYSNPNSRRRSEGSGSQGGRRNDVEHTVAVELAGDLGTQFVGLDRALRRLELSVGLIGLVNGSNISEFDQNRFIGSVGLRAEF